MAEWGRKEYSKKWPSRRPVWGWTAIFLTGVFFFGVFCLEYWRGWTAAERLYLMDYLKSGARGQARRGEQSKYTMLEGVVGEGQSGVLLGDQVERVADVDGKPGYRLTDEGVKAGLVRLEWVTGQYNDRGMHALLGRWVFKHDDIWGYMPHDDEHLRRCGHR